MPIKLEKRVINVRPNHACTTQKPVRICAIDEHGELIGC